MLHYQDEIDWKDLRRKPEKLFGYSYLYVLGVLVVIGVMYVSNLTLIGKNSVHPVVLADSSAFAMEIPLQAPRIIPPVDVMTAGVPSPDLLKNGQDLYRANCASCHGDNGQGDGPTAPTLNPKPRNFHSLDGWTNGSKVSQIYKTLQEGIPGRAMASYSYMPPLDRFALIHFVRTFASGLPQDTPEELKQLDVAYQISRGMNVAGQIPIKKAERLVIQEHQSDMADLERLAANTAAAEASPGAELFRRVTNRQLRALATLRQAAALKSVDEFMKAVTSSPIQNGFRPEVDRLTAPEWSTLYQFAIAVSK